MTLYAETSAILRWLLGESDGEQQRLWLAEASRVVTSRLTLIEVQRVLRRADREGRITSAQSADLQAIFARAAATWSILELVPDVARRAGEGFPQEPVRTLDAIHLASALFLRHSIPELTVLTSDERIRSNAALLGLDVSPRGG